MTKPTGKGRGGPRTAGPGKKIGRPRVESTVYEVRIPDRILGPWRVRHGRNGARLIREFMEQDNERAAKRRNKVS